MSRSKTPSKADLIAELEELKKELHIKRLESEAMGRSRDHMGTPTMVPVKNVSASDLSINYEYNGIKKNLHLSTGGIRQNGVLPLEVWLDLERESPIVQLGSLIRTDRPITNVNSIDDVQEYLDSNREDSIRKQVEQIENASTLYKVYNFLSAKEEKTSKELIVMSWLRERLFKVTGVRIVEGDID